jgi:hypothetical protein
LADHLRPTGRLAACRSLFLSSTEAAARLERSSFESIVEIPNMLFAYFTPDVALPLASAVAAVVGSIMLVGRAPIRFAMKVFRYVGRGVRHVVDKLQM